MGAHRLATLLLRPNVGKAKLSAIMVQLMDGGMVITVSLKEISARRLAIHPPQLVVLKARRPATWGQTLDAGWATIVYPRSLTVLQSVTTLLPCHALKEKSVVTWEHLPRDAGWETTVIRRDLNAHLLFIFDQTPPTQSFV